MSVDAICNVLALESHIAITQNGCGTYLCVTLHTPVHHTHMKLHHMNTLIDIHTIHFLHRSRKQKNLTV